MSPKYCSFLYDNKDLQYTTMCQLVNILDCEDTTIERVIRLNLNKFSIPIATKLVHMAMDKYHVHELRFPNITHRSDNQSLRFVSHMNINMLSWECPSAVRKL